MRHRMRHLCLLSLLVLVSLQAAAADKPVPFLSGHVVDEAGMIPEDARQRIDQKLIAFEQSTGAQVAVLTVESLDGDPLEDYSMRVVETWKLGKKEKDNGVLLLIAEQDRKMRIEVGYGLEGELTDLESGRIVDNVIRPDFQKGDFAGGIEHGVDSILERARRRRGAGRAAGPAGGGQGRAGRDDLHHLHRDLPVHRPALARRRRPARAVGRRRVLGRRFRRRELRRRPRRRRRLRWWRFLRRRRKLRRRRRLGELVI